MANEIQAFNDPQAALTGYNDEAIQGYADIIKRVAPWARGLNNQEIGLTARRALSMGLDPLNTHEVQIWKDKRGNVNFQVAYTLMAEWVKRFKGDHTEPQYYLLTSEQLEREGLAPDDIAYRVKFIMKSDLQAMREMLALGVFDAHEVRAMFEVTGIGTASRQEYNGPYFAPAARSKSWKVKKRALTDAYRCKFGTPTKREIEELRRFISDIPDVDDLEYAVSIAPDADYSGQKAIAAQRQALRESTLSAGDVADAQSVLFGDPQKPAAIDADVTELEPEPEPQQQEPPHWTADSKDLGRFWAWALQQGLNRDQVHEALDVASVKDFTGSKEEAAAKVRAYAEGLRAVAAMQADEAPEAPPQDDAANDW